MAYEFDSPVRDSAAGESAPWRIDVEGFRLSREGVEVRVEPKVFDLLALLVQNRQRVVSKTELLDTLWPKEHVGDAVLPRCVAVARKTLGDTRALQAVIQTIHGRGYRFVADTREVAERLVDGGQLAWPLNRRPCRRRRRWVDLAWGSPRNEKRP